MEIKEKLVELIDDFIHDVELKHWYSEELDEKLADDLIAHGVTVQEWISVKDSLPEDASTVLAIDSYGTICSAYYVGRWHSGGDLDEDAVTHWMPLPQPPKGE